MNRERIIQIVVISVSVTLFLILLFYTMDYVLWKDNRIKNNLAKQYCDCTLKTEVQNGDYELMEEGFVYAKGLENCWANDFAKYKEGLTELEKEAFIEDLRERIFERCAASNDHVLKGVSVPDNMED